MEGVREYLHPEHQGLLRREADDGVYGRKYGDGNMSVQVRSRELVGTACRNQEMSNYPVTTRAVGGLVYATPM